MSVIDYAKIAQEEKAKQDAIAFAAIEKQRQEEASREFFKCIEAGLANEMMKANPELQKYGLLTGHKTGGISMDAKRFETQIRLTYGRAASCEVNFDQPHAMVQVDLILEQSGPAVPQKVAFRIGKSSSGTVAGRILPDQEPMGRFLAEEIAEIVVAGLIRGHFD